jgi:hypothetical protein
MKLGSDIGNFKLRTLSEDVRKLETSLGSWNY